MRTRKPPPVFCCTLSASSKRAPPANTTDIDTAFGLAKAPAVDRGGKPESNFTGVLPEGWTRDTGWAKVAVETSVQQEVEQYYLRVDVRKRESGWAQIAFAQLPPITEPTAFRLSARLRNGAASAVTLGIRQRSDPYKMLWKTQVPPGAQWVSLDESFRLAPSPVPVGLWIMFEGAGPVDMDKITLHRVSEGSMHAALQGRYPDGGPSNILRNTRLPLGLPSGWFAEPEAIHPAPQVTVDRSATGPSGFAALRIEAPEPSRISLEPFAPVYPLVEHEASVALRGEGTWNLELLHGGKRIAQTKVGLDLTQWKRFALKFQPELEAKVYTLRLTGSGKVWIDALQAGPAGRLAYQASTEAEVALAITDGDAAGAGVQFDDERKTFRYAVTGLQSPARLRLTVTDVYGQKRDLPAIDLSGEALVEGSLDWHASPEHGLGAFRINAQIERDNKMISPVAEQLVYHLRRPRHWGADAPDSPFGVHVQPNPRHMLMAKSSGINWVRLHDTGIEAIGWNYLEPQQGKWQFQDEAIERYRAHHLSIYGQLGTAPGWASYFSTSGKSRFQYWDQYFQPLNQADFATYVRTVAERYKGTIAAWHVWNEPWIDAWWGVTFDPKRGSVRDGYITSEHPQRDFVKLQETAFASVNSVAPDAVVTGFNTTTNTASGKGKLSGTEWTRGVVEAGGLESCDVIDYHQYTREPVGFPGDAVTQGLKTAIGPVASGDLKTPKPLWMSEGSATPGLMGSGFYDHTIPYDDREDFVGNADRQARYVLSLLAQGVEKVFLYAMHTPGGFNPDESGHHLMQMEDGALHPAAAAISNLAWHLNGTRTAGHVLLGAGLHAMFFQGDGRAVAVLSTEPAVVVPALQAYRALSPVDLFGNPLSEVPLQGQRLQFVTGESVEALRRTLTEIFK